MIYRKYGKTNEMVSNLGFGCMRFPTINNNNAIIDEKKAIELLRHAIDQGVNYVDTAYPYHGTGMDKPGNSEPLVAKALRDGYRERVLLATKLPSWLITCREDMDKYLDMQLKRLETKCIDFYLVHTLNKTYWPNLVKHGISDFLDKARASGKIKHAGFSFHDETPLFKDIVDYYDWSFCQIQYNYLDENSQAGREGLDYAVSKGLGIAIMEPLRGGALADKLPEPAVDIFKKADKNKTPAEWALRWLWNHPEVSVVLSGMTTMDQLQENLVTASTANINTFTDKEAKTVREVQNYIKDSMTVGCTGCGYCMPCPNGVNIPCIFSHLNNFFLFDDPKAKTLPFVLYTRMNAEEKADNCIECGECEKHCPQGISIIENLRLAKESFIK